jgi:FKBP-type peptidyl-prolyl cis-trans isomerase
LCVIFQIWVPSVDVEMGVTLRALGMSVESRSSVAGFTYGYRMMFCRSGVAPGASRPMLAVIRPHSSKLAEFASSWMPFPCRGMATCGPAVVVGAVPRVSNLKVPGWDKGLVGQTVGSRILLVVPPADGYGAKGSPPIGVKGSPPIGAKDTMVFVVDILAAT